MWMDEVYQLLFRMDGHLSVDVLRVTAGGILGYVTTSVEQIILAHLVRVILSTKPSLLKKFLFVKDGPLAFFGQTANLHRAMRDLVNFLFEKHDFFCVGL